MLTYPGSHGGSFTEDSAQAELSYMLEADAEDPIPPTLDDVRNKIKELTGYTNPQSIGGLIDRALPMAHPIYQNLVVTNCRVTPVQYEPLFDVEEADPDGVMEAVPLPDAIRWYSWRFDLTFGPRPYPMFGNSFVIEDDGQWTDPDGVIQPYTYFNEWDRYTTWTRVPKEEYVKARIGSVKFRRQGGAAPDGKPYSDFPRLLLPDDVLIVKWWRVPYRYIRSAESYLIRFRNHVNQFAWEDFPPGCVLYRGFKETRVNPPFAELDPDWGGLGVFATNPLCDIELEFWTTSRRTTDAPTPANANFIAGGFNAFPSYYHQNKFFYASSDNAVAASQTPFFRSFPLEILFTDPDLGLLSG